MFCEKCGAQNADGAKFCASCGAPLNVETAYYAQPQPRPQQPDYQYGYPQQPQSQPQTFHPAAQKPQGKTTAGVVIFMISGALAVLSLLFPFLPHVSSMEYFVSNTSMFGFCFELFRHSETMSYGANIGLYFIGLLLLCLILIPMILQVIWAILSFVRVKAAGVVGIIASIVFLIHSFIWMVILAAAMSESGYSVVRMTPVPILMVFAAIAGIVLASLQIAKRKNAK